MTPAASGVTPDQDIIDELRGGDRTAAFRKLVERFDERIFRLCCSILRDHALAEDAAQESLMRIWRMIRHSGWRTEHDH
ncbi:MAG: sigma factor [Steroidobacteraceae bacterium]